MVCAAPAGSLQHLPRTKVVHELADKVLETLWLRMLEGERVERSVTDMTGVSQIPAQMKKQIGLSSPQPLPTKARLMAASERVSIGTLKRLNARQAA